MARFRGRIALAIKRIEDIDLWRPSSPISKLNNLPKVPKRGLKRRVMSCFRVSFMCKSMN
jgi:hypothetical protein